MSVRIVTIEDVHAAEEVVRPHVSAAPLIRSYELERALGLPESRRVWLKDYGWTPSGSFKCLGAVSWMANNLERIGNRPVAAHSSGNFASGSAYAGMRFNRRVIVVMPQTAPQVKFQRTRAFGAEVRTYNIARDHLTGERDRLTREIVAREEAVQASPYDDPHVIAGNGVGALEIVSELRREGRTVSHFFCPVNGGGLMAGQGTSTKRENGGIP
ncbi:MAG TPA: pyridoxal-phosphate dependent enzyme [Gemmataceae bacterium]|nr:pyridoxal-phosphate dependent enzyme [Gemmataceae bacterium]